MPLRFAYPTIMPATLLQYPAFVAALLPLKFEYVGGLCMIGAGYFIFRA